MKYLQEKYIKMMNLPLLDKKGDNYNFRCIICGDSKKSKFKKRGWFKWYKNRNTYLYYCFNCSSSHSFDYIIKEYYSNLYYTYRAEKQDKIIDTFTTNKPDEFSIDFKKEQSDRYVIKDAALEPGCKPITECPKCLEYINIRNTPNIIYKDWYYLNKDIIIPFYKNKKIYGYQKRNIEKKIFYVSLPEENIKIWNWYNITSLYPVYLTESVFDAAVFYNLDTINDNPVQSVALIGKEINSKISKTLYNFRDKIIFCFDNDTSGKISVEKYSKIFPYAKYLYWDEIFSNVKDINELYNIVGKNNFKKYIENYCISYSDWKIKEVEKKLKRI